MPGLRRLSGPEVAAILKRFGFREYSQRGSHLKLRRNVGAHSQTITIPLHAELDTGTLRAIYRQIARFVPESELRPLFYLP